MTVQAPKQRIAGTVGVAAMETGRFTNWGLSMGCFQPPPGWVFQSALNHEFAHAANCLAENFQGERLFLMDDDHAFEPNILHRLLDHDLDIVVPLCMQRRAPFAPVPSIAGEQLVLTGEPGLRQVEESGTAGMLIHRRVFDALDQPYFWAGWEGDEYVTADVHFSRRVREAGFTIFIDTAIWLAHYAVVGIRPHYEDERWSARLSVGNTDLVDIQQEEKVHA